MRLLVSLFIVAAATPAFATEPGPKLLPNGTGDGYADFAPDAYGALTSSECGGGLLSDRSVKGNGAAEFDPWDPALTSPRGRGGVICNARIHIFSLDDVLPRVRSVLAAGSTGYYGVTQATYPDGTVNAPGVHPGNLIGDSWQGPDQSVRRTRFLVTGFPGLQVDLDQRAACAALTQVYRFTNLSDAPIAFRLAQTSDTDLGFGSNFLNNWGWLDLTDPYSSRVYNNARDVALLMRARVDFDTEFEGWRIKVQNSAAWELLRAGMYYGFPAPNHEIPLCLGDPSAASCPTPGHLNGIYQAVSGSHADSYGIAPEFGSALELPGDLTGGPGDTPDGWSDAKWDIAQNLQSVYVIPPGESREYRTLYEGFPSYCTLQVDAGFDHVVALASATSCAETVTLDGARSIASGNDLTYTWFNAAGLPIATGVQAVVAVIGSGEHRFDLRVCNGDGICDVDFVAVIANDTDGNCGDSDRDGLVDAIDLDDDDDGLADVAESAADSDADSAVDGRDLDADGDGIPDLLEGDDDDGVGATDREALVDVDRDGQVDLPTKVDANDNGWDDRFEADPAALPDFDGDGIADVVDVDDDGDHILTRNECPGVRPCPASPEGQPDYLHIERFACSDLHAVSAGEWLGAGGSASGTWLFGDAALGAVARDGWTGHLYAIDAGGLLWRITPGDEALIGDTLIGPGVTGLAASPERGQLVAVAAGTVTSTFYDVASADASSVAADTVDGVVGDVTFDAAGTRVYSRSFGGANQLVSGAAVTPTAAFLDGLAILPDGALIGLHVASGNLRVSTVDRTIGALTTRFEPTRVWRPALTPVVPFDLALCPANLPPDLVADYVVTPFGQSASLSPLANDRDRDGEIDPTTFSHGPPDLVGARLFANAASPSDLIAVPPPGFVGAFGFDYQVSDDDGLSATSRGFILVAPDAQPDVADRAQGAPPFAIDPASNDLSGDDRFIRLGQDAPAWVVLTGERLTLSPPAGLVGTHTFTYQNCYPSHLAAPVPADVCSTATVTVHINARPTLGDASDWALVGGAPVDLALTGLYSDPEGDPLDATSVTFAPLGSCTLTLAKNGTHLVATPGASAEVCAVRVFVCDSAAAPACTSATWTITVNDPPIGGVVSALVVTESTTRWSLEVLLAGVDFGLIDAGIDMESLAISATIDGPRGPVAVTAEGGLCTLDVATGEVTYVAPEDATVDHCTLHVCELRPASAAVSPSAAPCGTIRFDLTVVEGLAPNAEAFVSPAGSVFQVASAALLANDVGVDPTTFTLVGTTGRGTLTLASGVVSYAPAAGEVGLVFFTYRVCAASDGGLCRSVDDALYLRAQPALAPITRWFAVPSPSGTIDVAAAFSGPHALRRDSLVIGATTGAATAKVLGTVVELSPTRPSSAATYTTRITACDAPVMDVPCGLLGPPGARVAFCGSIAIASACTDAVLTWIWNDPPNLVAVSLRTPPNALHTVALADLITDTAVIHGDAADGDSDGIDQGATLVSRTYDLVAGVAPFDFERSVFLDRTHGDGLCAVGDADDSIVLTAPPRPGTYECAIQICEELPDAAPRACSIALITLVVPDGETLAEDDRYVIAQGATLDLGAAAGPAENDHVVAGDAHFMLAAGGVRPAAAGSVTLAEDGALAFVPTALFVGEASFDYELRDDFGAVASATVVVVVNDPPVLTPASIALAPGESATVALAALVTSTGAWHGDDPDDPRADVDGLDNTGVRLGAGAVRLPIGDGECVVLVAGDVLVRAPSTPGSHVCTVTICEELPLVAPRACATTTVNVTVAAAPIAATDDAFAIARGGSLVVAAPGVLMNDSAGLVTLSGPAPTGDFELRPDGALLFTPPATFAGVATFDYRVTDRFGAVAVATVTIVVNDPPTLVNVSLTLPGGSSRTVALTSLVADLGVVFGDTASDGDSDGLRIEGMRLASGQAQGPLGPDGTCAVLADGDVVVVAPSAAGVHACQVQICEEVPLLDPRVCALATITVDVPEGVTARDDRYMTLTDHAIVIDETGDGLLGNDGVSGGAAEVELVGAGPDEAEGVLTLASDGTFELVPATGFAGELSFDYALVDGFGQRSEATVVIVVNDPPIGLIAALNATAGQVWRWSADDLVTDLGVIDGGGVDPGSVAVTAGPCTLGDDGEVTLVSPQEGSVTCQVVVCEVEPADPRACGEARLTVNVVDDAPEEPTDEGLAASGGACSGGAVGGLSLWAIAALALRPRRRVVR